MLILPKYSELYAPQPVVHLGPRVGGYFKMEAVGPDGRRRMLADWWKNLITNGGLNNIGGSNTWCDKCFVGTGNTPPAFTDSALNTYRATNNSAPTESSGAQASAPYYWWFRRVYRFNAGTASGNLTEVAIGPTSTTVTSRSLILDGLGNPTTITVLAIEQLDVTWEFRMYPPLADATGVITLDGQDYNWVARAQDVTGNQGTTYVKSATGAGSSVPATINDHDLVAITAVLPWDDTQSYTVGSYSNGTYYKPMTMLATISDGNFGTGVRSMAFKSNRGDFQYRFGSVASDAKIPKDNTKELTINFRVAWARH